MTPRDSQQNDRRAAILALMLKEAAAIRRTRILWRTLAIAAVLLLAFATTILVIAWPTRPTGPAPKNITSDKNHTPADPVPPAGPAPAPEQTIAHQPSFIRMLIDPNEPTSVRTLSEASTAHSRPLIDPGSASIVRVITDDELLDVLRDSGQCASIVRIAQQTTLVFRDCAGEPSTQMR